MGKPKQAEASGGGRRARRIAWLTIAAIVALLLGVLGAAWFVTPSTSDVQQSVAARVAAVRAKPVPLSDVSPWLREAVVATEDERFYAHHGIDMIGVIRATAYDVSHFTSREGASTITEQLVKALYLQGDDHSPWRKLEDAAMAFRVESRLSKQQILQDYLNTTYFGQGAYGAQDAAQRYFNVSASRLTLSDASLLAGLIQAPTSYDPFSDPAGARDRQAQVLESMIRNGFITQDEGERALRTPLPLSGGQALAPLTGASLAPGPQFSGVELRVGLLILLAGLTWLLVCRRLRLNRALVLLWIPAALVGAMVVARSFRFA